MLDIHPEQSSITSEESSTDQTRTPDMALLSAEALRAKYQLTAQIDELPEVSRLSEWGNALLGKSAQLWLEVQGHSDIPIQVMIQDALVIGRVGPDMSEPPDIDLTPFGGQHKGVSRRHVLITKDGNLLKVSDLHSTNGTYLNGVRLQPRQPRILRTGDQLSLGQLIIKVVSLV